MTATPKKILLVEDDQVVRLLTLEVLEEFGYQVLPFEEAPGALEALRGDEHFDLLMTDVGLPGMDGRQLVRAARQLRPNLPVLFASGYGERELLDEVRASHPDAASEAVVKPYDLALLERLLGELTGG
ncbi:response regulator [Pseudomonas subflava]|uniref:response regulator n=1 Tax=Pseudomonas subflava TaxID=2952933 RepID=UPI0020793CBA|nr:response regulator [Pseudomonas subflava]